jgi:hypothetical protein
MHVETSEASRMSARRTSLATAILGMQNLADIRLSAHAAIALASRVAARNIARSAH